MSYELIKIKRLHCCLAKALVMHPDGYAHVYRIPVGLGIDKPEGFEGEPDHGAFATPGRFVLVLDGQTVFDLDRREVDALDAAEEADPGITQQIFRVGGYPR